MAVPALALLGKVAVVRGDAACERMLLVVDGNHDIGINVT